MVPTACGGCISPAVARVTVKCFPCPAQSDEKWECQGKPVLRLCSVLGHATRTLYWKQEVYAQCYHCHYKTKGCSGTVIYVDES